MKLVRIRYSIILLNITLTVLLLLTMFILANYLMIEGEVVLFH